MKYDTISGMWAVDSPGRRLPVLCHTRLQAVDTEEAFRMLEDDRAKIVKEPTSGVKFNKHALWIGMHYSDYNRRLCVTIIPGITFWIAWPGGRTP